MIEITPDLLRRVLDGDHAAQTEARELLPRVGNLMGRWATHPEKGRVLCVYDKCDYDGEVVVHYRCAQCDSGNDWQFVTLDSLEFDPVELVTEKDFHNAPGGTIVVTDDAFPRMKIDDDWGHALATSSVSYMAARGPWKVVRWGWGEQA